MQQQRTILVQNFVTIACVKTLLIIQGIHTLNVAHKYKLGIPRYRVVLTTKARVHGYYIKDGQEFICTTGSLAFKAPCPKSDIAIQ